MEGVPKLTNFEVVDSLETVDLGGCKKVVSVVLAEREKLNLRKEIGEKGGLEVYGLMKKEQAWSTYMDQWMQGHT